MMFAIIDALRQLSWTPNWWEVLVVLAEGLALLTIPSVLLQRRGRPQAAITWVLVLFLLPYLGLFLWWVLGRKHLERRRRKKRRTATRLAARLSDRHKPLPTMSGDDLIQAVIDRLPAEEAEWIFPSTHGNQVELLQDAADMYPAMERLIEAAKDHIHLLFYIWQADRTGARFRDQLVEKAKQGVEVRVLVDAIGSAAARGRFMDPLRDAGAKVRAFLPPVIFRRKLELNFRNHRKLALTDARTAIVGGINIGDEYLDQWRDSALLLEGPVVDQLQEVFADDWFFTSGEDFSRNKHFGGWRGSAGEEDSQRSICTLIASGAAYGFEFHARVAVYRHQPGHSTHLPDDSLFSARSGHRGGAARGRVPRRRCPRAGAPARRFARGGPCHAAILSQALAGRREDL